MYTGTFDPPTEAHHAIMRSAIRDHGVKRLVVAVNNVASEKVFKCTAEQRRELLVAGMDPDIADRVEVVIEPPKGKNALFEQLHKDSRYAWVGIIGADSFTHLPPEAHEGRRWLIYARNGQDTGVDSPSLIHVQLDAALDGVSASRARELFAKGESVRGIVRPGAAALIAARGYYAMPVAAALADRMQRFDKLWTAMAGAQTALEKPAFVPTQSPEEAPNYLARYIAGLIVPAHD